MKNEDIYNGITEIDDALIDRAAQQRKKRPRWRVWLPAAAAALAVCVGLTALWPREAVSDPCVAAGPTPPSQSQPVDSASISPTPEQPTPEQSESTEPVPPEDWPWDWNWGDLPDAPTDLQPVTELPYAVSLAAYPVQNDSFYDGIMRGRFAASYDGGNEFFAKTLTQFLSGSEGENRVVSPLNLYMALAMVAETCEGDSRAQILDALGVVDLEQLRDHVRSLWNGTYQEDEYATTILANSLWMNENLDYNQETTDTLAKKYYASAFQGEMGSKEYTQTLRDWVNLQTGGLLEEQANGLELPSGAVMSLVSTIYYQAMWHSDFDPEDTAPGTFHAPAGDVTCDFMHGSSESAYYLGDGFSAVSQFLSESGSMYFILPDEGTDIDTLLDSPTLLKFLNREYESERVRLNLTVPKFDACSDLDLREGLSELGITGVFDPEDADFSPLLENGEGAFISKVEHAARVSIDEEGCTGAAYTAVVYMGALAEIPRPVDFTLDRPFLFLLISEHGLPLFAGVVNVP